MSKIQIARNPDNNYDRDFKVGDYVQHFKGGMYKIVAIATHTESRENLVIYQSLKDKKTWARPYAMFVSEVDKDKYPDVEVPYRLVKVYIKDERCKTCKYINTEICEKDIPCMEW